MFGNLFAKTTTTIATGGSDTSGDAASAGFTTLILIVNVSRANSKSDEAHVVATELENLAAKMAVPNLSMVQMRDYLCRVAYICMMGYEVEFACIHAVKLAQLGTNYDKRIGSPF
ncbi:AP-4 complex subunit epsilon-1-like [Dreissena polymorpha]|uniref:AP-4 complex subunit epsilon-1-like n=1 Tax=Dreissena polymorpha TaxID=45954 RepID=UPI0022648322|nr:AP-4 complex subunit epsilon-1-like [Dreissena polymorpha]